MTRRPATGCCSTAPRYSDHSAVTALTAASLGSVSLLAGATAITDTLAVRAFNGSYWGDWQSLAVTIVAPILPPVLATQTQNQTWTGGKPITLSLPATTFKDPQGQALSYAARLSNGQALPGWLTFNATTDTFSGTAPITAQTLGITVTATDRSGLSVSESFSATVLVAPMVTAQTPSQIWTAGKAVSLALPANTFTDPRGQKLVYTASQANGQALPTWLGFNATTETFSGTAPATVQSLSIKVVATDSSGLSVFKSFSATVLGAPVVTKQTPNQTWTGGKALSLALPANTFTDPQGQKLVYTASQANGQALPTWLGFNATTETFSGTAPATVQSLSIKVVATDSSGLSVSESFSATVLGAPVVMKQTPNQTWTGGKALSLALPVNTFTDPQGQKLVYTASQSNGQALPTWLGFNATTETFSGTAPTTVQSLSIKVVAADSSGLATSESFAVNVQAPPPVIQPGIKVSVQTPNQTWVDGQKVDLGPAREHLHRRAWFEDDIRRIPAERTEHDILAALQSDHGRVSRDSPGNRQRDCHARGYRFRCTEDDCGGPVQRDLRGERRAHRVQCGGWFRRHGATVRPVACGSIAGIPFVRERSDRRAGHKEGLTAGRIAAIAPDERIG